jgi:hypothetical protein
VSSICSCKNIAKPLCDNHFTEHLQDRSIVHTVQTISHPQATKIVLSHLQELQKNVEISIVELQRTCKNIVFSINEKYKAIYNSLFHYENEIKQLIRSIKQNNLPDCALKKILTYSPGDATKRVKELALLVKDFSIESIIKSIQSWNPVSVSLERLYAANVEIPSTPRENFNQSGFIPAHNQADARNLRNNQLVSAIHDTEKVLRCQKNHKMKYELCAPFISWETERCYMMKCDICSTLFSDAGWHCSICNSYISKECATKLGFSAPQLECEKHHPLKLVYDARNKSSKMMCAYCEKKINGLHWACEECKFFVCQNSSDEFGFSMYKSKAMCDNNHELIANQSMKKFRHACNKCKKIVDNEIFACNECKYYLCIECKRDSESIALHPVLQCEMEHYLCLSKNSKMKTCDYCLNFKTIRFHCEECCYFVCDSCSELLMKLVKVKSRAHCKNKEMILTSTSFENEDIFKQRNCSLCKTYFPKVIMMFYCMSCKEFLCLSCYDNPRSRDSDISSIFGGLKVSSSLSDREEEKDETRGVSNKNSYIANQPFLLANESKYKKGFALNKFKPVESDTSGLSRYARKNSFDNEDVLNLKFSSFNKLNK